MNGMMCSVIVNNPEDINSIPRFVTELTISPNTCNDVTQLELIGYPLMNRLLIGSNSLQKVNSMDVRGSTRLEEVIAGEGSLTMINE